MSADEKKVNAQNIFYVNIFFECRMRKFCKHAVCYLIVFGKTKSGENWKYEKKQ